MLKNTQGFTLIEMLVVVGIIALMMGVMMPSVSSYFQVSLNAATRDLATTVKQAYNSTVITGNVHRLAYDLKENSYWVESGPADVLLDTKESLEKADRRKKFSKSAVESGPSFKLDPTITRKKISLPRGVTFEDVITQQSKDPITEGTATSHFFPHGLTEQTIIHLQDQSKHHASLVLSPLAGLTDVYDRYVTFKEVFEK